MLVAHRDIAREHDAEPAAHGDSVDRGEHRLGNAHNAMQHLMPPHRDLAEAGAQLLAIVETITLQIDAGAEGIARPGQHHGADICPILAGAKRSKELRQRSNVERVLRVRSIDRDGRHAVRDIKQNGFRVRSWRRPFLPDCASLSCNTPCTLIAQACCKPARKQSEGYGRHRALSFLGFVLLLQGAHLSGGEKPCLDGPSHRPDGVRESAAGLSRGEQEGAGAHAAARRVDSFRNPPSSTSFSTTATRSRACGPRTRSRARACATGSRWRRTSCSPRCGRLRSI